MTSSTLQLIGIWLFALPLFVFGAYNIIGWRFIATTIPFFPPFLRKPCIFLGGTVLMVTSFGILFNILPVWSYRGLALQMAVFSVAVHIPNTILNWKSKPVDTISNVPKPLVTYDPIVFLFKDIVIAGACLALSEHYI